MPLGHISFSADGFYLCPPSELIDGDVEVAVAPRHSRERAQDIQSPDREWPRERDGLEALSRLMDLLGVELAGLAGLHQLSRVVECRRPVESAAECLTDEGPRRRVVSAVPAVYVNQQLPSLVAGYAAQCDIVRSFPT